MKNILLVSLVLVLFLSGCEASDQVTWTEKEQQGAGQLAIVKNQPIPDLGGYSFERQIMIETYLARNNTVSTYAYMFTMDGKIVEICASIGYPIPYSTHLTSPDKYYSGATISNAEPNSLYPPSDAAATLVQCVNPDGSVTPVYIEWYVLAFPYRIKSDYQLERIGDSSFSVDIQK